MNHLKFHSGTDTKTEENQIVSRGEASNLQKLFYFAQNAHSRKWVLTRPFLFQKRLCLSPKKCLKYKKATRFNYITRENINIRRAYVAVSEKKQLTYYKRTYSEYKKFIFANAPVHRKTSITSWLKGLQKKCVQFLICFNSIKARKQCGGSEDDETHLAAALYNKNIVQLPNKYIERNLRYSQKTSFEFCQSTQKQAVRLQATLIERYCAAQHKKLK